MKKFLLLSLLQCIAAIVIAQSKNGMISGIVNSNDGKAIEAATILLLKEKDSAIVKSAVTDKQGQFVFAKIPGGKYFVSVTSQGYQNSRTNAFVLDSMDHTILLTPIGLSYSAKSLTAVTVITQKPFVERKIDRLIVNVASSPLNAGQSAFEVLEKSPGVTIDENDNISLAGKQGVMIFIDGKPSYLSGRDLTNYLRGIPASQLDQLEIMTQPPARYDAAGDAGIINFKTKKNQANGFNGTITASPIFSYHFKTRNSLTMNWKKNKFSLSATYSYAALKNYVNQHIERKYRANAESGFNRYLEQDARLVWSQYPHNARLSVDYNASKNITIGIALTGSFSNNAQQATGVITVSDSLQDIVQFSKYTTRSKNDVSNPGINLNLQQKLSKGKEITADADYVSFHNPSSQSSCNYVFDKNGNPLDPFFVQNNAPLDISIYSFKTDYSQPLPGRAKLEAGVKTSYVKTDNDVHYNSFNKQQNQWVDDTGRTNHFIYEENINAAYLDVNKQFNRKWSLQAGLRFEQTNAKGNELVKSTGFKRSYAQLFPTLYISYAADDKNNFTVGYDRRINRPGYQFLNPFQSVIDQFTFQQGNPLLKPFMTDNFEASYNYKGILNITINYTLTHHLFSPLFSIVKQGDNYVTIQKPVNAASRRNTGIDINYHRSITKWWNTNSDLHLFNNHFNDIIDSSRVNKGITIYFLTISNQFILKKGWTLDLSGFYRTKRFEGFPVYAIRSGSFSFGLSKKIKNRSTVTMNFNDPLRLLKGGLLSDRNSFIFRTSNRNENRYLVLTFNYRFGKAIQQQNRRNNGSAQDEQNRL